MIVPAAEPSKYLKPTSTCPRVSSLTHLAGRDREEAAPLRDVRVEVPVFLMVRRPALAVLQRIVDV